MTANHEFQRDVDTGLLYCVEGGFAVVLAWESAALQPALELLQRLKQYHPVRGGGRLVVSRLVAREGVDLTAWEREHQLLRHGIGLYLSRFLPAANLEAEVLRLQSEAREMLEKLNGVFQKVLSLQPEPV